MTTAAQQAANQANADKSTGPRTEHGKARARMNAVKHGGYMQHADSITATLLDEDPYDIDELYEALLADLGPKTSLQLCQAAAIAQQIINQQRLHGLTAAVASSAELEAEVGAVVGPTRSEHRFWENLAWAVGTRKSEPTPMIPCGDLARELHRRNFSNDKQLPKPAVEPTDDLDANLQAWRQEVLCLVEATIGPAPEAFPKIVATRDRLAPQAEREARTVAGIEAQRILASFDKTSALHDRVSRMIARDLKSYRELKKTDTDTQE